MVSVLRVADLPNGALESLLSRYGLQLEVVAGGTIPGSFWGDSEAGIIGMSVYVRAETPVHSVLHEAGHTICMSAERRTALHTDAGGDDLEEAAVCFLQLALAEELAGVGRDRLMLDMDAWGYGFRLGDTRTWYERDAEDAHNWLIEKEILDEEGRPTFALRR